MSLNKQEFKMDFAGQPLTLSVSRLAEQANAAVLGTYGDTSVLATVVMGKEDRDIDFFPLTVDYEEKFYAAGKIIGSRFVRREGRPSEAAILSGRLVDRTIRPLFDHRLRRDVQIVLTVLSYDEENDPDFVALLTASTALMISQIPWDGPAAGVRLTKTKDGEIIINPINSFFIDSTKVVFDAFVAGAKDRINMIELSGNEAKENEVIESFNLAQQEIKKLLDFQKEIVAKIGKPKMEIKFAEIDSNLKELVEKFLKDKLEAAVYPHTKNNGGIINSNDVSEIGVGVYVKEKIERQDKLGELKSELKKYLVEQGIENIGSADAIFEEELDKLVHKNAIERDMRPDGRKMDEVRELYAETGLFKRLHGSALFMRGNTQALAVTTLAAPGAEQLIETIEISGKKRFMLHYNFPPYCTGETGRMGGVGRREVGHGNLAYKAVLSLIPSQEEFPYTIRVVSEILSSNGSSSMASVCAASLSLMDAGVPIKKPAAGIAMGLMSADGDKYKILTDIQGPEDHYGDMDCKIAGTADGVTAVQMDVKIDGITLKILEEVLAQAKKARLEILNVIKSALPEPRKEISKYAPAVASFDINPEQIGMVVGPGGKMINSIIRDFGLQTIDIEQTGKVFVAAVDQEKVKLAVNYIKSLTREFQVGEIVEGEIIKILDFGAIVDLGGGNDGMIHVSELKEGFVKKVEDVVKIGDRVRVKVVRVEEGRIGLSMKALSK